MEIYVGYAVFLFIAERIGLQYSDHKKSLTLYYGKGQYYCAVMPGKDHADCGYIAINNDDYEVLFGEVANPIDLQTNEVYHLQQLARPKQKHPDGSRDHCTVDISIRSKINIPRADDHPVKCFRT